MFMQHLGGMQRLLILIFGEVVGCVVLYGVG